MSRQIRVERFPSREGIFRGASTPLGARCDVGKKMWGASCFPTHHQQASIVVRSRNKRTLHEIKKLSLIFLGVEKRKRCTSKCPGTTEPGYTLQTFEKRGSLVRVTIRNIPADVCPFCHETFVNRETARILDRLLDPFHGKGARIPSLPAAEVTMDFIVAAHGVKAA
ncbi:MAG: type II toxin-antitoxin system MqsA family antitoxin [Acidobacteria bacterium]|nr:type II toxin-antitoxin system MqsA family antitoxin [Acidobacteriota bacterium]